MTARSGFKVKVLGKGIVLLQDGKTLIDVYPLKDKACYKDNARNNEAHQDLNAFTTIHNHQFIEWFDGQRTNLTMVF